MLSSRSVKYARALADVAADGQREDAVRDELLTFGGLLDSHPELRETLTNPALPFSAKRRIVEELGRRIPLSAVVVNFTLILMEHARLGEFGQMMKAYLQVLDERRGMVAADVDLAQDGDASLQARLEAALRRSTGRKVKLNFRVDEALLGGLKLRIGSTIVDGSVRTQLENLRRHLLGQQTRERKHGR